MARRHESRGRIRIGLVLLVIGAVILIISSLRSMAIQRSQAERIGALEQALETARGEYAAALSGALLEREPGTALLVGLDAARRRPTRAALSSVLAAVARLRERTTARFGERPLLLARSNAMHAVATAATVWLWQRDWHTPRKLADISGGARPLALALEVTRLFLATADGHVRTWKLEEKRALEDLRWRVDGLEHVDFLADKSVALVVAGGGARIVDLEDGETMATLVKEGGSARRAALARDGSKAVVLIDDGVAVVHDAESGRDLHPLVADAKVVDLVFSPDGVRVGLALEDGSARVLDAASGLEIAVLRGHRAPLTSIAFDSRTERVLTTARDSTVRIWSAATGDEIERLRGHLEATRAALFADERRELVSIGDTTLRVWSTAWNPTVDGYRKPSTAAVDVDFHPKGARILAAYRDGTAAVFDRSSGERVFELPQAATALASARFDASGRTILTVSVRGTVSTWNAASGEREATIPARPDGRTARSARFFGGADAALVVFEGGSERVVMLPALPGLTKAPVETPDNETLAVSAGSDTVEIKSLTDGETLQSVKIPGVTTVLDIPSWRLVAAGTRDGEVVFLDTKTGRGTARQPVDPLGTAITDIAVATNANRLVASTAGGHVIVIALDDLEPLFDFSTGGVPVLAVAIDPDESSFAFASIDGTVRELPMEPVLHAAELAPRELSPPRARAASPARGALMVVARLCAGG